METFERTSWSKQHTHKFEGSHVELAAVAGYDKFAESFENNDPEVCDARSLWMIDCRKLDGTDRDKKLDTRWSKLQDHEIDCGIQGLPRSPDHDL